MLFFAICHFICNAWSASLWRLFLSRPLARIKPIEGGSAAEAFSVSSLSSSSTSTNLDHSYKRDLFGRGRTYSTWLLGFKRRDLYPIGPLMPFSRFCKFGFFFRRYSSFALKNTSYILERLSESDLALRQLRVQYVMTDLTRLCYESDT